MKHTGVRNIIFDLGGVILNIDPMSSVREFARLCQSDEKEILKRILKEKFLYEYERGEITCNQFREKLRQVLRLSSEDHILDMAWNKLLLDIPQQRIELLQKLARTHRLFLLSNTNRIHHDRFIEILKAATGAKGFEEYFEAVYYSFLMRKRKPEEAIYRQVLEEQSLEASQTLFIDDNIENLESAAKLGINTLHVQNEFTLEHYFSGENPVNKRDERF